MLLRQSRGAALLLSGRVFDATPVMSPVVSPVTGPVTIIECQMSHASAFDVLASALRTFDIAARGLEQTRAALTGSILGADFERAVAVIHGCKGRLIISGVGKSGHIGRKLAATFASTGTQAYFVHPTEASHGDLGMIGRDDVILALSWSGEPAEMAAILQYAKRFNVPVISITSGVDSTLAKASTVALVLPKAEEACPHGLAPTTSTMLQLVVGDALAVALLEARGFTAMDFKVFHPGGRLGAQLTHVRELMQAGDLVPTVLSGSPMEQAIAAMSRHSFGVVGIVDDGDLLIGVITDGDIRRNIHRNLLTLSADEVMTRSPKTIGPEVMAAEALEQMERNRITSLFVVEEGRVVGFLRSLELLRAGVK